MRALMAAAIVLGLVVPTAAASSRVSKPVKYTLPSVAFNASTGVASAVGGSYFTSGKKQLVKFTYQYNLGDQAGNHCGPVSQGLGQTFKLKLHPYALKARFGLKPTDSAQVLWGKWRAFALGGIDLQCGVVTSTSLPPVAQLCAWSDQGLAFLISGTVCGVPAAGGCAWSSSATLVNGVFTVGSVSCPKGPCRYNYISGEATVDWWSSPVVRAAGLKCPDGSSAGVGVQFLRLGHYDNHNQFVSDCEYPTREVSVLRFTISPDIGGVLQVDSLLAPSANGVAPLSQWESQTSQFNLGGSQNGCPLNLASLTGH